VSVYEPARDDAVQDESMLAPGELRQRFASIRAATPRTSRWMAELVAGPRQPEPEEDTRVDVLREREERLAERERELERREAAVARWFRDLSRAQRRLEEERRTLPSKPEPYAST
jgi:hypothetical protein